MSWRKFCRVDRHDVFTQKAHAPAPASFIPMKREIRVNSTRARFTSSTMIKSAAVMRSRKNAARYG